MHLVWNINPGESFMLIGGFENAVRRATDIVYYNGTIKPGFNLRYDTISACGFEDNEDNSYIVTGGTAYSADRVVKYARNGTSTDLPSLNIGRREHGCGTYINQNNKKVKF